MAAEAGQLQLNVMEPVIAQCLFESLRLLRNAMSALRERCVAGITANADHCRSFVLNSIGIVTFLDPIIGHEEGDEIGRICARTGRSVSEVARERGVVDKPTLERIFSIENLLRPKYEGPLKGGKK
jgi:aspartate ammonia-lyase